MNVSSDDHKLATDLADELEAECVRRIELARRAGLKTVQVLMSAGDGAYIHIPVAALMETFVINRLMEKLNLRAKIEQINHEYMLGGGSDERVYTKHARWMDITL